MALSRKYQKIFGKNAVGIDMGVVGSKSNSTPQYSKDVEVLQSLSNWETGLRSQVTSSKAPYLQDQNSIFYVITSQLAYLFQAGIAEWDSQTEYIANRSVVLKNGKIFIAIANSTNVEPEVAVNWTAKWYNLTNWVMKGLYFDPSFVGYEKGARLLYQMDNAKIYIESLVDSNTTEPNETTIYFVRAGLMKQVEALLELGQTPTEQASSSNLGKIYLVKGTGAYSPYYSSTGYICVKNNDNTYSWSLKNVSELFLENTTVYRKDNGDYLYFYAPNILVPITNYKWIYIPPTPSNFSDIVVTKIETDVLGGWCKIYSNGWIEQGGITDGGNSGDRTITFKYEMADTEYFIGLSAGIGSGSGSTNNRIEENKILTTGFTLWSGSPSKYRWEVKGYMKPIE